MRIKPGKKYYDDEGFVWQVLTRKDFHEAFEKQYGKPIVGENASIGKDQYYVICLDHYIGFVFNIYFKDGRTNKYIDNASDLIAEVSPRPKKSRKTIQAKHIPTIGVLRMIKFWRENPSIVQSPWESLVYFGYNPKVIYAKFEKLERKGYLNSGFSTKYPWLTEKGEKLLKELECKNLKAN